MVKGVNAPKCCVHAMKLSVITRRQLVTELFTSSELCLYANIINGKMNLQQLGCRGHVVQVRALVVIEFYDEEKNKLESRNYGNLA